MIDSSLTARRRGAVIDFAHALVAAVLERLLHARDNRYVADALRTLVATLAAARELGVAMPLELECSGTRLCHDGEPLEGPSLQARTLLQRCAERHIAALSFAPGADADELNRLLDLLLLEEHVGEFARDRRAAMLVAFGIRNVGIDLVAPGQDGHADDEHDERERALHHYQELADALQQNHRLAHRDMELAVDATAGAVERTVLDFDEPSLLLSLAMQDDVDRFTVGHSVRVALLALQVANELGASREQLVQIGAAALMHDIGKSKVPQEILFKRGRLTPEEWEWMMRHPRLGAQILIEQHEQVDPRAIGAAFCHHMRPNGSGYPDPTLPVVPSGTSRLIRVCDVFEALTAVRPYKKALTPIEAYAVMFRNQCDFDPVWLRRFVHTLGLFPTGTRVQLADGADGLVVAQTDDPARPRVRLLSGATGSALPDDHPGQLVVGQPFAGSVPRIVGISSHERFLTVPEFDVDDPAAAEPPQHACMTQPDPPAHR